MDEIHTIQPEGSLVGTQAVPFIQELSRLLALDCRLVVVDVRKVDFLTKDAVQMLRRTAASLEARDDALVVLAPNEMVRGLLRLHDPAGDIPIFQTREELEEALQLHLPMHGHDAAQEPVEPDYLDLGLDSDPVPYRPPEVEPPPFDPVASEAAHEALSAPGLTPADAEEAAFTPSPPPQSRVMERLMAAAAARRSSPPVPPAEADEIAAPEPWADPELDFAAEAEAEAEAEDDDSDEYEVQVEFEEDRFDDGRLSHAELDALTGNWPPPDHEHAVAAAPELDAVTLARAVAQQEADEAQDLEDEAALGERFERELMAAAFAEAAAENPDEVEPTPEPVASAVPDAAPDEDLPVWPPPEDDPIPHGGGAVAVSVAAEVEPEPEHVASAGPEASAEPEARAAERPGTDPDLHEFDEVGIAGALDQLVGEGVFGSTSPESGMRLVEPDGPSDPPASPSDEAQAEPEDEGDEELGPLSIELQELLETIISEETTPTERWKAVRSLGRCGDPSAVPFLEELAMDPEPTIREMAAVSLRRLGALPTSP